MADSKQAVIVPLTGSNYATWKVQCTMALKKEGVWGVVSGTETAPAEDADDKVKERYAVRRDKALATIVLSVDTSLLYLLGNPDNPLSVWRKLEEQFQKKSWVNRLNLRRKLHSLKLKDGESVQEHVKTMVETFNELSIVGDAITDEDRVVYLLASLPESFNTLVTALESNPSVPAMEIVIERLIHEERKLKDRGMPNESVSDRALATKQKMESRGPKCYGCQRYGHIRRNCPENMHHQAERRYSEHRLPVKKGKNVVHLTQDEQESGCDSETVVGLVTCHVLSAVESNEVNSWIVDSGATCHICNNKQSFLEFHSSKRPQHVTLGDGHSLSATGTGNVVIELLLGNNKTRQCHLSDVLYVPELSYNLLSVSKATEAGKRVEFHSTDCQIVDQEGKVVAVGLRKGNLYYLSCQQKRMEQAHMSDAQLNGRSKEFIWHKRFGHLNEKSLRILASQQLVDDFDYNISKQIPFCESCVEGKLHKIPFPSQGRTRAAIPLGLVHSDVCGPMSTQSLSGARYFVIFADKTHYVWVYFLKCKSEVFNKFLEWKSLVERLSNYKLKILRTDNGGEYTSREFSSFLKAEGIRHELTISKHPEQNGVSERLNRTLVESVRSMLVDAQLPHKFWAEALSTAVFLRNLSFTSTVPGMTPSQAWSGKKPSVNNLKVFGCAAYSHIPKDERGKLTPKARKCIFLGYGDAIKGYRLFDPIKGRVIHSRDVVFNENSLGIEKEQEKDFTQDISRSIDVSTEAESHDEAKEANEEKEEQALSDHENSTQSDDESPVIPRRSERTRQRPDFYGVYTCETEDTMREPANVNEALSSPEKEKWVDAMEKEMHSIKANEVWELVKLPEGKKTVGCKWVFKRKLDADGSIERHKARLVAKGYSQQQGLDYDETFSPVARFESLRMLLALAVQDGLCVHQLDVTTAFLNGKLEEEVYMDQPEGFVEKGKEGLVCQLKHSLYGLKQAPRCWNSILDKRLKEMEFTQTTSDPCIYVSKDQEPFIIGICVDDILLAGRSKQQINEVKLALAENFNVKDLGELSYFLGVKIVQDCKAGTIWIGQPIYTEGILKKYGMENCKPVATPADPGLKLTKGTEDSEYVKEKHYQSMVGSLLYLSMRTRPDIAFAVSHAARFCSKPTSQHLTAVKRILRYLRGTTHHGLLFKSNGSKSIIGYSDADWGGDITDSKSTTGYLFQLGGAAITWQSKKQTCTALSTAEAEYVALAGAAQEAVWLKQLNQELTGKAEPVMIHEDNQSTIAIAKNPQFHGRVKHINIKYHFIREQVSNHNIKLKYCQTSSMIADMLTKGLGRIQFKKLREMAGVVPLKDIKQSASEKEC